MEAVYLRVIAVVLALVIAACGSGAGEGSRHDPSPAARRDGISFGYYGAYSPTPGEVRDHADLLFVHLWSAPSLTEVADIIRDGKQRGFTTFVIDVEWLAFNRGEEGVREWLALVDAVDLTGKRVILYTKDEPDVHGVTEQEMMDINAMVRKVAAGFPSLKGAPLGVFYSCRATAFPAVKDFDIIGCDAYGERERIFTNGMHASLEAQAREDASFWVIPGGWCMDKQDPRPFIDYAVRNPRVIAVVPFIWVDIPAGCGIRSGELRSVYRAAAQYLLGLPTLSR